MPYSSDEGKPFAERTLRRFQNARLTNIRQDFYKSKTILDIGAGSGTYSNIFSSNLLPRNGYRWEAVEIWEPYIKQFDLPSKYEEIHIMGGIEFLKNAPAKELRYDVIFMGDVIEHMTKEEAQQMVAFAKPVSSAIIISVPIVHYPQDEYEGNPYEAHIKDDWSTEEMLESFDDIVSYGADGEIGVFVIQGDLCEIDLKDLLKPEIGVYAIFKDEADFMNRFLHNVADADQLVICDTGSTDGSENIRLSPYIVTHKNALVERISVQPWRFDDARNTAMGLMRHDLDLCISIDIDESLPEGWHQTLVDYVDNKLKTEGKVPMRIYHSFQTIWDWDTEGNNVSKHFHERLHSRLGYRWKLPVHEILVGENETSDWLESFLMTQKPDTTKNRSSYLQALEVSLREDPTIWKSWTFYSSELAQVGRVQEAIEALESALKCDGVDQSWVYHVMSTYLVHLGRLEDAIQKSQEAVQKSPNQREYKVYLSNILFDSGDIEGSEFMYKMASRITLPSYSYAYNETCWGNAFEELGQRYKG